MEAHAGNSLPRITRICFGHRIPLVWPDAKSCANRPPFRVIRVTRPKIFHFLETNLKMATAVHEHVHVNVNEIRARGRLFDLVAARLRRAIRGQGFF